MGTFGLGSVKNQLFFLSDDAPPYRGALHRNPKDRNQSRKLSNKTEFGR